MADSLDDFFAKRDKKKGTNKGKSQLTSEALVKELEEEAKLPDYPIRKDLKASALSSELLGLDADDADWRDFEDVDRKDYTGLKIQTISLEDQNEEELKRLQAERYEANLDAAGPWKKKDQTKQTESINDSSDVGNSENSTGGENKQRQQQNRADSDKNSASEKSGDNSSAKSTEDNIKPQTEEPPAPTKYMPPAARNALLEQTKVLEPSKLPKRYRAPGHSGGPIPDLEDQSAFPSLG